MTYNYLNISRHSIAPIVCVRDRAVKGKKLLKKKVLNTNKVITLVWSYSPQVASPGDWMVQIQDYLPDTLWHDKLFCGLKLTIDHSVLE